MILSGSYILQKFFKHQTTFIQNISLQPLLNLIVTRRRNIVPELPAGKQSYHFFIMCQHFFLDKAISFIYYTRMKAKRPTNPIRLELLASLFVGLREGSRLSILGAPSRGFNSPQVHRFNAPLVAGNYQRGSSSGRSQKDGVSRPAAIFAPRPGESKGENDVPQLPYRMQEIWKDS